MKQFSDAMNRAFRVFFWAVLSYAFVFVTAKLATGEDLGYLPIHRSLEAQTLPRLYDALACGVYILIILAAHSYMKLYYIQRADSGAANGSDHALFALALPLQVMLCIGLLAAPFCGFFTTGLFAIAHAGVITFLTLPVLVVVYAIPIALGLRWWKR